jgi:hypothetical protein
MTDGRLGSATLHIRTTFRQSNNIHELFLNNSMMYSIINVCGYGTVSEATWGDAEHPAIYSFVSRSERNRVMSFLSV